MYLSRIKLNPGRPRTISGFQAPNIFHGAIEIADEERTRKLWRVDHIKGEPFLTILSPNEFDLTSVAEQFGYSIAYECKKYDPLLDRIDNNSKWRFKITANPTESTLVSGNDVPQRGKRTACYTPLRQLKWLEKRSDKHGFHLEHGQWRITTTKWLKFKKNRNSPHTVNMLAVTYEGILTVTDAEKFKETLINGIGKEKAYGMGMLTIVRV